MQNFKVQLQDEVTISLKETPTTGFRWTVLEIPRGLVLLNETFQLNSPPFLVGGGGTRSFRLRAEARGTYDIQLQLKRPWEPRAIETELVRVVVDDT